MSNVLVTEGAAELKGGAVLDQELRKVLPSYSDQLYRDAQARFQMPRGSANDPNLTAALLRPICIDQPSGPTCYGLPPNVEALRRAFVKDQNLCPGPPAGSVPDECKLRVDDAAISVAIASDLLISFIQDELANAPELSRFCAKGSEAFRCSEALLAAVEQAAELFMGQTELARALDGYAQQSGNAALQLLLPASKNFLDGWRINVPAALANPTQASNTFFLSPDVRAWLGRNASSYQSVILQLRDKINAERLIVAKLGRNYLDGLVSIGESRRDQLRTILPNAVNGADAVIKLWREASQKLSEEEPSEFVAQISRLADSVLQLEQPLSLAARHLAVQTGSQCTPSPILDAKTGVFDVCFGEAAKGTGVAGFRFTFAPCLASGGDCDTAGHIDLLLNISKPGQGDRDLIPASLGITDLRGTIALRDRVLRVRRPPAPAFNPDVRQLTQSARLLLPYPFQLRLESETVEVADGPVITMTVRPTFSLPSMPALAPFRVSMGPTGLKVDDGSGATLRAAVIKRITSSLQGREIPIAGLKVTLNPDRLGQAAGCDASGGGLALTLDGVANLRPALNYAARVSLNVACDGRMRLALDGAGAQGILDQVLAKVPQSLSARIAALDAAVDGTIVQFSLRIADGCTKAVTFDLAASTVLNSAGEQIAAAVANCAAVTAARAALSNIPPFAGLPLQSDGNRACTANLPVLGRICLSPAKDLGKVPLSQIRIEDDGKFVSAVKSQLSFMSPIVDAIQLRDGPQLVLPVRATIPGLAEPVAIVLPVTGNITGNANLADALNRAVATEINARLRGKRAKVGPIDVADIQANGDAGGVVVTGKVHYGGVGAGVKIQLIPSLSVSADAPNIQELVAKIGMSLLDNPPIEVKIDPDGVPALHWPIKLNAPLFGDATFEASTVVNARANGDIHLGSVGVTLPGWLTVGYFAVGRAIIEIDLDHPENVGLGALLTIAPGEGTSELARLRGMLRHDANRKRVDLDGDLALVSIPLAKSEGYWNYQRGVLDLQMGSTTNVLPLPRGRLVVDGPDCSIIGTASYELLGAGLAEATAGFLIGNICKRGTAAVPEIASKMSSCGGRGGLGTLCLLGSAQLGNIVKVDGRLASRLDGLHPIIDANFGLLGDGIKVQAHLSTVRARLKGNVLNILKVTISLPTLSALDGQAVTQLFLNLLKPNIDLQALLSGKFTINPFSPAGKGDDGGGTDAKSGDDDGEGDNDGDDLGDGRERAPDAKQGISPEAPRAVPTTSPWIKPPPDAKPGSYLGPPGPCQSRPEPVNGGPLYRVMLSCPGGTPFDEYRLFFNEDDAKNLASGRLVLQFGQQIRLDDGRLFQLACAGWPCKSDSIVAVSTSDVPTKRALRAPTKISLPIGEVYRGAEVRAVSLPFVSLASLLAKQQLSGAGMDFNKLRVICVRRIEGFCDKAVVNVSEQTQAPSGSKWSVHTASGFRFAGLSRDSFAHHLLEYKCPASKECDASTAATLQQWDRLRIYAMGRGQPTGLPRAVAARIPGDKAAVDALLVLGDDGNVKQQTPITYEASRYPLDIYEVSVPTCIAGRLGCTIAKAATDASVPLLDDLAAASTTAPIRIAGYGTYAAAAVGKGEAELIFSALMTEMDSLVCSRSAKWSDIKKRLSQNLDQNNPLYGIDIDPDPKSELATQLFGDDGDQSLMRQLIKPPQLTMNGYHRSPLQFFPTPDINKNCVQVGSQ